jgi:hypothetical protein
MRVRLILGGDAMTDSIIEQVTLLEPAELAPIVRGILGDASAQVQPGWRVEPAGALFNGRGTLGLWKVTGDALSQGETTSWSVILKVFVIEERTIRDYHHEEPEREIEVYRSDLFDVPSGMRPATCYRIQELDNGQVWLWLEDLSEASGPPWSDAQYLTAARKVGIFNGYWLQRSLP